MREERRGFVSGDERYHAHHVCPKKELMILIVKEGGEEEEFDGDFGEMEEDTKLPSLR